MKICLCSAFRNAASKGYLDRYFAQVAALQDALRARGDTLRCIWGEGDSTDDTAVLLLSQALPLNALVVEASHGGPVYGSVVDAQRFRQLAHVCNRVWECVPEDADAVVWCESDLSFESEALMALTDRLRECPAVAPMVMHRGSAVFYDLWAFRKNGQHFRPGAPYFDGWPVNGDGMVQVDSAGSCLALRGEIARQVSWPEADVAVGLCREVYKRGGSVTLDTRLRVEHP